MSDMRVPDRGGHAGNAPQGNRRDFLSWLTGLALAGSGVVSVFSNFVFIKPRATYGPPQRFTIGKPDEYPPGTRMALPSRRICVVREEQQARRHLDHLHPPGLHRRPRRHRLRLPLPRLALRPGRQGDRRPGAPAAALVQGHAWPPTANWKWTRTSRSSRDLPDRMSADDQDPPARRLREPSRRTSGARSSATRCPPPTWSGRHQLHELLPAHPPGQGAPPHAAAHLHASGSA